jgi:hypothetical protein
MTGPAWTIAPLIGLDLRARVGVDSVWILLATCAVAGAVAGVAALRAS